MFFYSDVNECTTNNPCWADSTCANTVGSYTCSCNDGFVINAGGDGCVGRCCSSCYLTVGNAQFEGKVASRSIKNPYTSYGRFWKSVLQKECKFSNAPTQQNSYSVSYLLGTVTTQWLPLWRCSHCSLVPDTVTTEQWLHWTHMLLGIHYHGAYVEICLLGT